MATLPTSAGTGPRPALPSPRPALFPTVNIAPATGWPTGAMPQAAPGTRVAAFARDPDHPRWLHVLPPVDVLTGFLSAEGSAFGRPVGVALDKRGALLVADDVGNVVWRVTAQR